MSARSILVRVFAAFFIVPAWLILPGIAPVRGATLDASRAVTYGTAAGTWDSAEVGLLRINQSGASVSGSYATGVFSGSISGHTITFSMWEEATSYNSRRLTMPRATPAPSTPTGPLSPARGKQTRAIPPGPSTPRASPGRPTTPPAPIWVMMIWPQTIRTPVITPITYMMING